MNKTFIIYFKPDNSGIKWMKFITGGILDAIQMFSETGFSISDITSIKKESK